MDGWSRTNIVVEFQRPAVVCCGGRGMEILMEPNYWGGNFCLAEVGEGSKSTTSGEDTLDPCVNTFLKWICLVHVVYVSSFGLRGCSHITSAKIRGFLTPPPPSVSNGQHLAYPPSPPRQLSSAFARRPLCTTIFGVDFFAL